MAKFKPGESEEIRGIKNIDEDHANVIVDYENTQVIYDNVQLSVQDKEVLSLHPGYGVYDKIDEKAVEVEQRKDSVRQDIVI